MSDGTSLHKRSTGRVDGSGSLSQMFGRTGGGLSAQLVRTTEQTHSGMVWKVSVPFIFSCLPLVLQSILLWMKRQYVLSWFVSAICPSIRRRFLCVSGSFIYRFESESSSSPKGAPVPLEDIEHVESTSIDSLRNMVIENEIIVEQIPPSCRSLLSIRTFSKVQYFFIEGQEASVWVRCIRQAKQECVTRRMGHSRIPYPRNLAYIDQLGEEFLRKNRRMKKKLEEWQDKDMEMRAFVQSGTTIPMSPGY